MRVGPEWALAAKARKIALPILTFPPPAALSPSSHLCVPSVALLEAFSGALPFPSLHLPLWVRGSFSPP